MHRRSPPRRERITHTAKRSPSGKDVVARRVAGSDAVHARARRGFVAFVRRLAESVELGRQGDFALAVLGAGVRAGDAWGAEAPLVGGVVGVQGEVVVAGDSDGA